MQRIVIDTNVLVSAFLQKSYPHLIIDYIPTAKKIQWCISNDVLDEYIDVLRRRKFIKYIGFTFNAENLLADVEKTATTYYPKIKLDILTDPDDNKFLELAATCKADFLITGNMKHFPMSSFEHTKIVTPKEYWEKHR